jgi:hypothetical protein
MDLQSILAFSALALAVFFLLRRTIASFRKPEHGGCAKCPAAAKSQNQSV